MKTSINNYRNHMREAWIKFKLINLYERLKQTIKLRHIITGLVFLLLFPHFSILLVGGGLLVSAAHILSEHLYQKGLENKNSFSIAIADFIKDLKVAYEEFKEKHPDFETFSLFAIVALITIKIIFPPLFLATVIISAITFLGYKAYQACKEEQQERKHPQYNGFENKKCNNITIISNNEDKNGIMYNIKKVWGRFCNFYKKEESKDNQNLANKHIQKKAK